MTDLNMLLSFFRDKMPATTATAITDSSGESAPDWQINADPRFTIRGSIELLYCGKMRERGRIWAKIQISFPSLSCTLKIQSVFMLLIWLFHLYSCRLKFIRSVQAAVLPQPFQSFAAYGILS